MAIYCKNITAEQKTWLEKYERETGFEPLYQEDIDSGEKTFLEAALINVHWYEEHTSDVHLRIQRGIPGHDEAINAGFKKVTT